MKNVQRRLSVGGKSKSHSLERSLGGIVCVCWNCAAENSVMCCTGSAHSKTAILLFLKSVWISCESEGALSTEICSRLFLFFFFSFSTDPAPVLEASHTLEGRLQQLQSSAPDSEALVREISGHWKKHLECLEKTGQDTSGSNPS